jgi:hypothetical protein
LDFAPRSSMEDNSRMAARPSSLEFYTVKASSISADARRVLREYSKIPEDEIEKHVEVIVRLLVPIHPLANVWHRERRRLKS